MHFGPGSPAFKNMQNQKRLVDGGMSYPESAAAIEAAKAEGREVGSVAEERARAAQRKASLPTPTPMVHKTLAKLPGAPDGPQVLFIEGFGMADFMAGNLLGLPSEIPGVPASQEAKVGWRGMSIKRISCVVEMEMSDLAAEVCRLELASGAYHAVVVVDLAQDHEFFEVELGGALQDFVRAGGAVAFPTSEGLQLVSTMARLFDTAWQGSGYYRTSWGAAEENRGHVRSTFGDRLAADAFSAKACSLCKVPPHERCFGVMDQSRTQSLVPFMAGRDVSKGDEPDSVTADGAAMARDYDVCVATHRFGAGAVAFFGDINCEGRTSELVAAFVGGTAKEAPVAAWPMASKLQLDADAYGGVMHAKGKGNTAFGGGEYTEAIARYDEALALYGGKKGAGAQREEKVKILSNRAECHLRMQDWGRAEADASAAIALEPMHPKSVLRRAKAYMGPAGAPGEERRKLGLAKKDLQALGQMGVDVKALQAEVTARLKALGAEPAPKPSSSGMRAGFLGAGGLGGSGNPPGAGGPYGSEDYDDDDYDDYDDDDDDEMGPYGFTHEEEMELLSQGVKPWDDDAHAVLGALSGDY